MDGHSLTLGGYNAVPGNLTFDSNNPVNRVIGVIYPDGTMDTSTQFPQSDASTIRSAASVDGTGFWIATNNYVRYVPYGDNGASSTVLSTSGRQSYDCGGLAADRALSSQRALHRRRGRSAVERLPSHR